MSWHETLVCHNKLGPAWLQCVQGFVNCQEAGFEPTLC